MAPSATPLSRPDGSALRVLVVDDEQMLTDLLSMALKMEGWDVRTAGSGFDALTLARDFDPDADGDEIPDPYYGPHQGFVDVLDMTEAAMPGVIDEIRRRLADRG